MTTRPSSRASRVARALAMVTAGAGAGLATQACGGPPNVPGYMVVASQQGGYCVCCPSGDWSGQCYSNPMLAPDAGGPGSPMTPPSGQRWCSRPDLISEAGSTGSPSCPIAGPLMPPELRV